MKTYNINLEKSKACVLYISQNIIIVQVLSPSWNVRDLQVWRELYLEQNRTPDIDPLNAFAARPGISGSADISVTSVMSVTEASTYVF